mmetsp:Transcript_29155/g.41581  ORF Transcript_29155/g.41581 Transcript_29155/m.41581 type:complete len:111 (+) Transcript_29155:83-415(+)
MNLAMIQKLYVRAMNDIIESPTKYDTTAHMIPRIVVSNPQYNHPPDPKRLFNDPNKNNNINEIPAENSYCCKSVNTFKGPEAKIIKGITPRLAYAKNITKASVKSMASSS